MFQPGKPQRALPVEQSGSGSKAVSLRRAWLAIGALAGLLPAVALATSSGLNNIPTTDTTDDQTLVIQQYDTFGPGRRPDYSAGFRLGLTPWQQRFEIGADGHLAPDDPGPLVLQAKYAFQASEKWPAFAIGVADLNCSEWNQPAHPFAYAMTSYDVNHWFRLHGGYGIQTDNNTMLLGIDSTYKVFDRPLTVRADAVQIEDQRQWMPSVGFLYVFHRHWALEAWSNFPLDQGKPSVVLKLNFILPFGPKK